VTRYNTIVIGLGATGSAALYQLAKRGARVLGIDQFAPPHDRGSSHGGTRITRLAIGEGAHYTPLVTRSHEIWREIERDTGRSLMILNSGLIISSAATSAKTHVPGFFQNTIDASLKFGIEHEILSASDIRRRFPQFRVQDDEIGYFEKSAGFLRPEECVAAQLELAERHGAEIHANEMMLSFDAKGHGVEIRTDRGTYSAAKLIVAAGAWLPQLLGPSVFKVYRQVQFWFDVKDAAAFAPERFPIFIWEPRHAAQGIYGFPSIDGAGFKIATEQYHTETTPDDVEREISQAEIAAMFAEHIAPNFAYVTPNCLRAMPCLYTVTPDAGFVVDTWPGSERVILASPCSGHGFKHSPAIGEILADMAQGRESPFDLAPFRLARFS
jgi:sarcosine oxidase